MQPTQAPSRARPTGRRVGDSGTRDAILDAALVLFAERGYDGASIRSIAAAAGVDPALIRHFFGDKDTLFATAVADRSTIPERLAGSFSGDPDSIGERVTDSYLQLWEDPKTRPILLALVRSATSSGRAADMLREILWSRARSHDARLENDDPEPDDERVQRIALAAAHLFGVAVARHVIALPPITALDHDSLVAQIAPTIQRYLTGTHQ